METTAMAAKRRGGTVLLTLAAGQFLMTLDTSVMNVSIASVAQDVGTSVTGIQTAITLYTLVMAMFMVTGGKIGAIVGRRRAFAIGCVVYGCGSLTTSLSPSLGVLIIGWSVLEGLGAVLIMPAIVALVASNFGRAERPRAYGLVASAGAMAVAIGPLVGGLVTTYFSWRWVFAGEVVLVAGILALARRVSETPVTTRPRVDLAGAVLSAAGLGMLVSGVLASGTWGWVQPKPEAPALLGLSPVVWLILAGGVVLRLFLGWERHMLARDREPLVDPGMLGNRQLTGGLTVFSFQFLIQAGLFFIVPLFLSISLGLSTLATGVRLLPLSVTLLLAAMGIPRFWPHISPRRVVQAGLMTLFVSLVVFLAALDAGAGPEVTTVPMLLAGLGIGALASQLGAVTVSAVPDERTSEVGGLQNTATNLGASFGTALAGSVLIAALTTSFLNGVVDNPAVPAQVSEQSQVQLASGAPFISDAQLRDRLAQAGLPEATAQAIVSANSQARIQGLRASLATLAAAAAAALFFTRRIPRTQPADLTRRG
ncbi:MFS transporter [Amycolatopsis sp. K13G38]|uniref:MFS transporter n=1 Tax=Amycolatopsis acididurans TaxID=2724524 RepID=A0ABX1IXT5_9PSEU|nr:MFS transporter [Amycolatopsis acididurans]NKQ52320.1 MFS transporter [Amycolatopsis acididurans]